MAQDHKLPPVFGIYRQRENQLTHGLAVALGHSRPFRRAFLKKISAEDEGRLPPSSLNLQVREQSHFKSNGKLTEETGRKKSIPDIELRWHDNDRPSCVLIEVKLTAQSDRAQATSHARCARLKGYETLLCVAVDTKPSKLPRPWKHLAWSDIYLMATDLRKDMWAVELMRLMETVEAQLIGQKEFGVVTKFPGIWFDKGEFTSIEARRLVRLMAVPLNEKTKRLGIELKTDKSITSNADGSIWCRTTSPIFSSVKGNRPHLNIEIGPTALSCMLTFPNDSFSEALRSRLGKPGSKRSQERAEQFDAALDTLATGLMKRRRDLVIKPFCYIEQKHHKTQGSRPRQDAYLEFDLRLKKGEAKTAKRPPIKRNAVWQEMLFDSARSGQNAHIQAGFGVRLPYDIKNRKLLTSPSELTKFVTETWSALNNFARKVETIKL